MGWTSKICRNKLCCYFVLVVTAKIMWHLLTTGLSISSLENTRSLFVVERYSNATDHKSLLLEHQKSRPTNTTCRYCLPHHTHKMTPLNLSASQCDELDKTTFQTELYCLQGEDNSIQKLFRQSNNSLCYIHGSEGISVNNSCKCKQDWYGPSCSVPKYVHQSDYPKAYHAVIREVPARIIYGFPFNHEFEMLEAKLDELGDLVDVFIIAESNFTAHGDPKSKLLLERLSNGYLQEYHSKIFHISVDHFPEEAHNNGWIIEEQARHMISLKGVSHIKHLRMDDVFIVTDADELPVWETIFFLKFHTGYPGPIGFNLKFNVYGFFWQAKPKISNIFGVCSVSMLKLYFDNNAYKLRGTRGYMKSNAMKTANYKLRFGARIYVWSFGRRDQPAGWHCSWCFNATGIRTKLLSAQVDDKPRWGDYPEKTNITYIESLIQNGGWFDDKETHVAVTDNTSSQYAPSFFRRNPDRAPHLLTKLT